MPKIAYVQDRMFKDSSLALIEQANTIIEEYLADDLMLTLRQLYYQFVARDLIPNQQKEYKRLGHIISEARLAGLVDWLAIEDRTRNLQSLSHWTNPGSIIDSAAYGYRLDHWKTQPYQVEVWIEKEALAGVITRPSQQLDIPYFSCRGYVSQSEMWAAAQRLQRYINMGKNVVILHLGDHDPSGLDMTRDIIDRLELFLNAPNGATWTVNRIALNMDQVRKYEPPPNPAKTTDSRHGEYVRRFGRDSWELDALEPRVLRALVEAHTKALIDDDAWNTTVEEQEKDRELLRKVARHWDRVATTIDDIISE